MSSPSGSSGKNRVSYIFSGNSSIIMEKLNGDNYLNWLAFVQMRFLGQRLSDHLPLNSIDIDKDLHQYGKQADCQLTSLFWQS